MTARGKHALTALLLILRVGEDQEWMMQENQDLVEDDLQHGYEKVKKKLNSR
jgi:hypothetical protein